MPEGPGQPGYPPPPDQPGGQPGYPPPQSPPPPGPTSSDWTPPAGPQGYYPQPGDPGYAAPPPKQFLQTSGQHNDGGFQLRAEWQDRVRHFIHRALPVPSAAGAAR